MSHLKVRCLVLSITSFKAICFVTSLPVPGVDITNYKR